MTHLIVDMPQVSTLPTLAPKERGSALNLPPTPVPNPNPTQGGGSLGCCAVGRLFSAVRCDQFTLRVPFVHALAKDLIVLFFVSPIT